MTNKNSTSQSSVTPVRATAIAAAVLFTDMLLHGLAIPILPLLPAVVEQGPTATGFLVLLLRGGDDRGPSSLRAVRLPSIIWPTLQVLPLGHS